MFSVLKKNIGHINSCDRKFNTIFRNDKIYKFHGRLNSTIFTLLLVTTGTPITTETEQFSVSFAVDYIYG